MYRGTLGIDEIEVSSGCHLLFGRHAHIAGQGWISTEGVLRVPTLTVADGGEVTVPPGLKDEENTLTLDVSYFTHLYLLVKKLHACFSWRILC